MTYEDIIAFIDLTPYTTKNKALEDMNRYYDRMLKCTSATGIHGNISICLHIYENCGYDLSNEFEYNPNEYKWKDRIKRREKTAFPVSSFDYRNMPNYISGIYAVGCTHINPHSDEEFYYIKIGQAKDIKKRLHQYVTYNPLLWVIGIKETPICHLDRAEKYWHNFLGTTAYLDGFEDNSYAREWFRVSKENYITLCKEIPNLFQAQV